MINVKCSVCGTDTILAEDPYSTPGATKYWKSTYDEPEESLFIVQRKIPIQSKKGRMTARVMNEHILAIYCSPECGLKDYGTDRD